MLPQLFQLFTQEAPHCRLITSHLSRYDDLSAAFDGGVDLAVGQYENMDKHHHAKLYDDSFVVVHSAAQKFNITKQNYLYGQHIRVSLGDVRPSVIDETLELHSARRQTVLSVPHYILALKLAEEEGYMLTISEKTIQPFLKHFKLSVSPYPFKMPPYPTHMLWHVRTAQEPAHLWLRSLLQKAA